MSEQRGPRDDWTMGLLADQGAYRGPWPEEYGPPTPADPWAASMAGAKEVGRSLIDMARTAPGHAARGLMSGIASLGVPPDPIPFGDTSDEFDRRGLEGAEAARERLKAATYEPQTMAGHYMGSVAEVMGNPLNWAGPGGAAAKAAWNIASGVGGEAGAQAAKGTPYEGPARLAGSFSPLALERGWQATGPLVRAMPQGQVGIFGGRMAVTADQQALNRAESMAKAGKSREDIWNDTGWFQGADGKWRFEIPDLNASGVSKHIDIPHERAKIGDVRVGDVFTHPDLYAAYPEFPGYRFTRNTGYEGARGSYRADSLNPDIKIVGVDPSGIPSAQTSTMLHELQHGTQEREGFARGSTPSHFTGDTAKNALIELYGRGKTQAERDALHESLMKDKDALGWGNALYRRTAGEVEARNVQSRMNMTPEQRRAQPPWLTQDVPSEQQLVQFRDAGPQLALPGGGGKMIQPQPAARMGDVAEPSGMNMLQDVLRTTTNRGIIDSLPPPPRTRGERIAARTKGMSDTDVLNSDELWAMTRDLMAHRADAGSPVAFSRAFSDLASRRLGRPLTAEEMSTALLEGTRAGVVTPRKLYEATGTHTRDRR